MNTLADWLHDRRRPARRRAATGALAAWGARLRRSLRARMALGVGLPILLAFLLLSAIHYQRELHLLETQAQQTAMQMGHMVIGSLRHAMLTNDDGALNAVMRDLTARQTIGRTQIVDLEGRVLADSGPGRAGLVRSVAEPGCTACHRLSPADWPEAAVLAGEPELMRVAVPIDNGPECAGCHREPAAHLGILLVDVPMAGLWPHAIADLRTDLAISVVVTLAITLGVSFALHRLVVRRVEAFRGPLAAFAVGQYGARLPNDDLQDEITDLAATFNGMADRLERQVREERRRSDLRQQAIVEERERIARELHDGLAQVLGYVNTKATAVRLLVQRGQTATAEKQLRQLEEAARGLFVDVREAILGLRMTGRRDARLADMIRGYTADFGQLCELPVVVEIGPEVAAVSVAPEAELQLLRVVQEALANVRKHASATRAWVELRAEREGLVLTIRDDGCGFDLESARRNGRPHFGLTIMRERAEAIGADFQIESQLGVGTQLCLWLPPRRGG